MRETYPHLGKVKIGRAARGQRQDGAAEMAKKILPHLDALVHYLVRCLVLPPNVLRDSTLQRLELRHFGAFVHVLAIVWTAAFEELCALTNATVVNLNPLEMHDTFDALWGFADILKGGDPLQILHAGYRPWPKVRPECPDVAAWYESNANSIARSNLRSIFNLPPSTNCVHVRISL